MNTRSRNRIASAAALILGLVTTPAAWAQPTGSIVAWGLNYWGQCNVPAPNAGFVAVSGGAGHSLGLKDGTLGDRNCDATFNGGDIDPFFLALGDPAAYQIAFPNCDPLLGDMNGDGRFNGADIDPFFACLGGNCP